jgi:putative spermidine/putrescine transport system permease protein
MLVYRENLFGFYRRFLMRKKFSLLLLAPGLILLALFLVLPLLSIFWPTIFDGRITFENYIKFFSDDYNMRIFVRTLRISTIASLVCVVLGIPTAYYISRCSKKVRSLLMALSMFPLLTNPVVRSFAWIIILGRNGVVNTAMLNIGLIKAPLTLLYTEFSILIGTIYLFLPIMIITLVGVMENIETDIVEAAETLGASRLEAFLKVILPLSVPGIIVGSVLVFTGSLTAYTTPQLLGGNRNMMMTTFIYQRAMSIGDWTGASVIAAIMVVTTFIVMKVLNGIAAKLDRRERQNA